MPWRNTVERARPGIVACDQVVPFRARISGRKSPELWSKKSPDAQTLPPGASVTSLRSPCTVDPVWTSVQVVPFQRTTDIPMPQFDLRSVSPTAQASSREAAATATSVLYCWKHPPGLGLGLGT